MDYSLPGSSIHGIFQARVLEWGAIAFSLSSCSLQKTIKLGPKFKCHAQSHSTGKTSSSEVERPPALQLRVWSPNWQHQHHLVFVYLFWLHWVSVAAHGVALVAVSAGCSLLQCTSFSLQVASLVVEHGL